MHRGELVTVFDEENLLPCRYIRDLKYLHGSFSLGAHRFYVQVFGKLVNVSAVPLVFNDQSLKYVEAELVYNFSAKENLLDGLFINTLSFAVLLDNFYFQLVVLEMIPDTARAVDHVLVDIVTAILCHQHQTLGCTGAIEQGQQIIL